MTRIRCLIVISVLMGGVSCGSDTDTAAPVPIPQVSFSCAAAVCHQKPVYAVWTTGGCSEASLAAGTYSARATDTFSVVGTQTLTLKGSSPWKNAAGATITTMAAGTYTVCVYVEAGGDNTQIEAGSDKYMAASVAVTAETANVTVTGTWSAVP